MTQVQDRLSDYLVNIVTSPFKQSVEMLITGKKGSGKSYAGLSIGYACAERLAERLGGEPKDYFNPTDDIAIVNQTEVDRVITKEKKFGVKLFDDISIGWGAREWRDKENRMKNEIFMINRVNQLISIYTLPASFLLDKQPRVLTSHYAEMSYNYYSRGFSTMKLFLPSYLGREGELIYSHISTDREKFIVYMVSHPPEWLSTWYDSERQRITEHEITIRRDALDQSTANSQVPAVPENRKKKNPRTVMMEQTIQVYMPKWIKIVQAGGGLKDIREDALKRLGIPPATFKYWKDTGALKKMGLSVA